MTINIRTIKNNILETLRDTYYTSISQYITNSSSPWPDANLYLNIKQNKNKTKYIELKVEIINNQPFNYSHLLIKAEQTINKYLPKAKHFKNINKPLLQDNGSLYSTSPFYTGNFIIKLTKAEAIDIYTLFKLTNKG